MKIEIELTDKTARWLRSMASLGRLCDSIDKALDPIMKETKVTSDMEEQSIFAQDALKDLKPVLMELHDQIRPQLIGKVEPLWNQNQ